MIAPPADWTVRRSGAALVLVPADPAEATIEVREVCRPLARLADLVGRELDRDPELEAPAIADPRFLATHEGEYAVLVSIAGRRAGGPARRELGLVLLDDSYACVSGLATEPARFAPLAARVAELVATDSHMLGVRRRRFLYQPPPGWRALHAAHETTWVPAEEPARAAITVWRAWPVDGASPAVVAGLVERAADSPRFAVDRRSVAELAANRAGLGGTRWDLAGTPAGRRRQLRSVAALQDDRYLYPARLEIADDGASAAADEAFAALLSSVQPIPRPRAGGAAAEITGHWLL